MNVSELIEKLKKLDPTLRVVTRGYEGGYEDVSVSDTFDLALDVHPNTWYYGDHEKADSIFCEDYDKSKIVKAICL